MCAFVCVCERESEDKFVNNKAAIFINVMDKFCSHDYYNRFYLSITKNINKYVLKKKLK